MKPAAFAYHRATSVAEALELLGNPDEEVKPLAGGQSLLTLMNLRLARPEALVDIGSLAELDRRFVDDDAIVLGALTTHRTVETDPQVRTYAPLLSEAARHIAHLGIRHRGTLGGTLAHADPAAELPASMICLGATFHAESSARGRREIPAEQFFESIFTSVLEPDELLTWVTVPRLRPGQGWGFCELARRPGDYALAGAAVTLTMTEAGHVADARGGLFSVADRPLLVTLRPDHRGQAGGPALWRAIAADWAAQTSPLGEDPDHVRAVCETAIVTALADAFDRAQPGLTQEHTA